MTLQHCFNRMLTLLNRAEECARDGKRLDLAVQHTLILRNAIDNFPYDMDMKLIERPLILFLGHDHSPLVEAALSTILVVFTRDFDVSKELMFKGLCRIASILSEPLFVGRAQELALQVLAALPVGRQHVQCMVQLSSCLHNLLVLFNELDFQCVSNDYLHVLIAALNASLSLPINKMNQMEAGCIIINKVITMLGHWINSTRLTVSMHCLQDILFLCQNVVQKNATNQYKFLQLNGVHLLARLLEEKELSSLTKPIKVEMYKNCKSEVNQAGCLLTNIYWLLDAVVFHYKPACEKAMRCGIVELLVKRIGFDIPKPCQAGAISVTVHIIEGTRTNIPLNMLKTIHDTSLQLGQELSPRVRESVKQLISRVPKYTPDQNIPMTPCLKIKSSHAGSSSFTRAHCFVGRNALAALHRCIVKHGMNFKAIRSEYPYQRNFTSGLLYSLWRNMWNLQ